MRIRNYLGRLRKSGLPFINWNKIGNLRLGILGESAIFGLQRSNILFSCWYILLGGFCYLRGFESQRILFGVNIKRSSIMIDSLDNWFYRFLNFPIIINNLGIYRHNSFYGSSITGVGLITCVGCSLSKSIISIVASLGSWLLDLYSPFM